MKIKNKANILIICMRCSGKSTLIRDILYHKRTNNIGAIFCRTEPLNRFYSDFCPINKIYYNYNKYVVIDNMKDIGTINIMDDCMSIKTDWSKQPEIIDMMNSDNINIFSIQFPYSFSEDFRDSFDYVFIMNEAFTHNKKRLHNYIPFIEDFDNFNKIMMQIFSVNNYNIMVIDNTTDSTLIEDRIFWYKANVKLPKFEMTNYKNDITICEYYGKNIVSDDEIGDSDEDDNKNIESNKIDCSDSSSDIYMSESTHSFTKVTKNKDINITKNKDINITINNDKIIVCKNNITVNILL